MAIIDYFRETKTEMSQVTWPSRHQAIAYTVVVIFLSIGLAVFLGFFDVFFSWLLKLVWH